MRKLSAIGILIVAGLLLGMPFIARADTDFSFPPDIPAPYTDYIMFCANGSGDPCLTWGVVFFDDSFSQHYSGAYHTLGTGDLITDDTQVVNTIEEGHQIYWNTAGGVSLYYPCDGGAPYENCDFLGNIGGAAPVTNGTSSNPVAASFFASSRNVRSQNGALLYSASTRPVGIGTRFISVLPPYASTTGFVVDVGARVYVNPNDWVDGTVLHMRFVNNTLQNGIGGSALDAWNGAFGGIDIPLVAGDNDVSTSTIFNVIGQVNWDLKIQVPNDTFLIGSFLSPDVLAATSSLFYVIQPTGLDIAMASTTDVLISALITGTTTQSILRCNPIGFSITECLISAIIPPMDAIRLNFEIFRDEVLTRFPIGYVTRFVDILTDTATTTLPSISYTFSTTSPFYGVLGGDSTIRLDPFGAISASSSPLNFKSDQVVQKTLWQIMEQPITILVYLTLLLMIVHDITGIHKHHKKK